MKQMKPTTVLIGAILAVGSLWMMRNDDGSCPGSVGPWSGNDLHCYIPDDYRSARAQFREALGNVTRAELETIVVVSDEELERRNSSIRDLTMDIGIIPGKPGETRLIMDISGVHGPEGHAGSGVQAALLHKLAALEKAKGADWDLPTMVFVHAVNPHGFVTGRRWNENGVDLNRNVLSEEGFQRLLAQDPSKDYTYKKIVHDDLLAGEHHAHQTFYQRWFKLAGTGAASLWRNGYYAVKTAIMNGQYHFPGELFYGGTELQTSHILLRAFLRRRGFTEASQVAWIDYHTGLGNYGQDTLLVQYGDNHANRIYSQEGRARVQFLGNGTGVEDNPVAKGLSRMAHVTSCEYPHLWFSTPEDKVLSLMQEFGTTYSFLGARAMILDFYAHHYGSEEEKHWAYENFREFFYIREKFWKQDTVERGLNVFSESMQFFGHSEPSIRA